MPLLDSDRLFPVDPVQREIARSLFDQVRDLHILIPHGHTEPRWYALDEAFPDLALLFVTPDHYVFRMLASQGVALADLGVPRAVGGPVETNGRKIWRLFAQQYHLFRGTPSRLWPDHVFQEVFGFDTRLSEATADSYYDRISEALATPRLPAPRTV